MKRFLAAIATLNLLAACGSELSDVRAGVPSSSAVAVNVPQKSGALLGQTADLYMTTYLATETINGGVVLVLSLLRDIVAQPPTSTSGKVYTWGPGAASPLEPNIWKLTVTDNGDGSYSYELDGARKNTTNFVTVLSGKHTPVRNNGVNDPDHGSGTFLLDWNARATLLQPDTNVGTANVTYTHDTSDVTVDVDFTGIHNSQGLTSSPVYHYAQPAGGNGTFEFSDQGNIDTASTALETLTIESRWDTTGAGRSDVQVSAGDLGSNTAQLSECWDTNFLETYYHDQNTENSQHFAPDQGVESSCPSPFATASFYSGS